MSVSSVVMETSGLMSVKMIDVFVLICHSGRFVRVPYPSSCFNIHKHVSVFGESVRLSISIHVLDFASDILHALIVQ